MKNSEFFDAARFIETIQTTLQKLPDVPLPPVDMEMDARRRFLLLLREFRPELAQFGAHCQFAGPAPQERDFVTARLQRLLAVDMLEDYGEVKYAVRGLAQLLQAGEANASLLERQVQHLLDVSLYAITFTGSIPEPQVLRLPRVTAEARKPRIVVADDDRIVREMMHRLFQEDAELFIASDGVEAHALILRHAPDLVILDDFMPAMTGFKLMETLRESSRFSALRILMLTGSDRPQDVKRAMNAGAVGYVTKPFDPSELVQKVYARLLDVI